MRAFWIVSVGVGIGLWGALSAGAQSASAGRLPTLSEQLRREGAPRGSRLEQLIAENQDFSLLPPRELHDALRIPLWLRVHWRKAHPEMRSSPGDPSGGYPLVLKEVQEWMKTHPDLEGASTGEGLETETFSVAANRRLSGPQSDPRSESDIRVNYWNPNRIVGASNNIGGTGQQAQWYSSDGGTTWGQTYLPLAPGDAFHSDPTVDWTSDGTAWSTTIGINSAGSVLKMRAYKSTDGGATWALDGTFSGSQTATDKQMMWVDHGTASPYRDTIHAVWHNDNPVFVSRRSGGVWSAPVQVSGSETTGTGIGADIKTNGAGEVFAAWPDTGSSKIYLAKSMNGGAAWGATRATVATTLGSYDIGVPSFSGRRILIYVTIGAYKTATKNNVYAVWTDFSGASGCTAPGNEPGTNAASACKTRIWFARSSDGGATWGAKSKLNDQSGLNDQYNPWLVVDETNGKVAVMYYDTVADATRKKVDVWYQSSSNDGGTWTAPLKVTTAMTDETAAGADSGNQFGDYNSMSGIASAFWPSWTDRRGNGREEIWSAKVIDDGGGTNAAPTANFTFTTSGLTASFTDASTDSDGTVASRAWTFGDGGTATAAAPTHAYAAAGSYSVTLTVTDNGGATGSATKVVTVAAGCVPPAAPGGLVASVSSQTAGTVSWSPSAGASSYGVYRSTTNGSGYTAIGNTASTSFAMSDLVCGTTYYFVATASNGTCSSGNSAQAVAATPACAGSVLQNNVPVTGIADATVGGTKTWTMTVPAGAANLSFATSGGSGDADLYVRLGAAPTASSYDCRPYVTGNAETCSFAVPSPGTYYVQVKAFAAYSGLTLLGKFGTASNAAPVASFTVTTSGLLASFTDTSTDGDGTIAARAWTFGDGSTSSAAKPTHTYAAPGTYSVALTVTDSGGKTASIGKSITVSASGCVGTLYTGTVTAVGGSVYLSSATGFAASTGVQSGTLSGPAAADFDLYLQKWNGFTWSSVAAGESASSNENVSYAGSAGTYRWRVYAYAGTGAFALCAAKP